MLVQRTQGVLDTDCNCRETFCSTGPPGLSSDLGLRTISQSWIWCRATLVRCLQDVSKDSSPILWIARDTVFISFYPGMQWRKVYLSSSKLANQYSRICLIDVSHNVFVFASG